MLTAAVSLIAAEHIAVWLTAFFVRWFCRLVEVWLACFRL